jgi:hypothetical protein
MAALPVRVISPATFENNEDPFPLDFFERGCLAQGDSWFSIGAIPPTLTTNVLDEIALARATYIVNCAAPGRELKRMSDLVTSQSFMRLLSGDLAWRWNAILLSGGGNDLIAWAQSTKPDTAKRLFLKPQERPAGPLQPQQYLSEDGWESFEVQLIDAFSWFVAVRDAGRNKGVAVVFHDYDLPAPRPAPAGPGFGPWLCKAMAAYAIPQQDWNGVTEVLFRRLRNLLQELAAAHPNVTLVDTLGTLAPAANDSAGMTADWCNEIHPTRAGYVQLAKKWIPVLDALLG